MSKDYHEITDTALVAREAGELAGGGKLTPAEAYRLGIITKKQLKEMKSTGQDYNFDLSFKALKTFQNTLDDAAFDYCKTIDELTEYMNDK